MGFLGDRRIAAPGGGRRAPAARGPQDWVPGSRQPGDAGDGCCFEVCLAPESIKALADELERRAATRKGANVRAPASCMQPVVSRDFDKRSDPVTAPTSGDPSPVSVLKITAERATTIKGVGVIADVIGDSSKNLGDSRDDLVFQLRRNGAPIKDYADIRTDQSAGLTALGAVTINLDAGDELELVVKRDQTSNASWRVRGRFKGWDFQPTVVKEGADGLIAY